jgi:3-oxoacyl-[acyl-carrier protein] reductase
MGRTAVVTGAGRGIGLAIARRLIADGWMVAGCDMLEDELSAAAGILGDQFRPYPLDVTDEKAVNASCERILADLGAPFGLVNNAGITRDSLLMRMDLESWEKVLRVNLTGAFLVTKAVSKAMMRQKQGSIVNISSVVALTGSAGQANYSASKAGLLGFTRSLAREFASRNIRVNAVAPGFIETEMTRVLPAEVREGYASRIPLARMGLPEDVADAVSFLLGDASSYVTGVVLPVDGGLST